MTEHEVLDTIGALVRDSAKSFCPVRTGNLRDSIEYIVEGDTVHIGTDVEYAPYVEQGTYKMDAQPYLTPALESNINTIVELLLNVEL